MEFIRLPGVPAGDGGITHAMGSPNHPSNLIVPPYTSTDHFISYSYELGQEAFQKPSPWEGQSLHRRCSSESFLLEKPAWFDDLLNEPHNSLLANNGHRRSACYSSAFLDPLAYKTNNNTNKEKSKLRNCTTGSSWEAQSLEHNEDMWKASFEKVKGDSSLNKTKSVAGEYSNSLMCLSGTERNAPQASASLSNISKNRDQEGDISSEKRQSTDEKASTLQSKPSVSKGEEKRHKQQSAQRSRIRKLQYIADLEWNIQVLKAEGSEVSAALGFLDKQKFILGMENRALRQRLDSLSQEHMIKHLEGEMLESEIARLRALYQLQMQHQTQHLQKKNRVQHQSC